MKNSAQHRSWILMSRFRRATAALAVALAAVMTQPAQAQTFSVIHTFSGGADGGGPSAGLTMFPAGTLYGVTGYGGTAGQGTVFKLTRKNSGWVFSSLYSFQGGSDG